MIKLITFNSLLGVSAAVSAEITDNSQNIEDIVVTAARQPQLANEVGASISVLGEEALQQGQFSFVVDALETLPGVSINQNGGFGGQAAVSIRGAATAQTVILIDGVQMNDVSSPAGGFNFGSLDPAGVERIEVLRGPQAVLYGSDAIGGVVNIVTKTGGGAFSGSAFFEYGAFDTFRAGGTVIGGSDLFGYHLSASGIKTDGFSKADKIDGNTELDGHESYTLRGRVTSKFNDTISTELFGSYTDSETDTDSFGPVDGPDTALSEDYLFGGRLHVSLLDGAFNNTLSVEYSGIDRASLSAFGVFPGKGRRLNIDYLGVYQVSKLVSLTAGAQHENVKAETASSESFDINSLFGMLNYSNEGFNFSAGLRLDDHETFGTTTNGQVRVSYKLPDTETRFFGNWGEGFKAPSVFQLTFVCGFCGHTTPSLNLRPESANAWEAGLEQGLFEGKTKVTVTYFDQRVTDLIDFSFVNGYDNLDRVRLKGLEVGLNVQVQNNASLSANYTYTSAKDRNTGATLVRRPKNQFYAALDMDVHEQVSLNFSVTHNGREVELGNRELDAWTRFDVRASYEISDSLELYARVDNVFDTHYQQALGYGTAGISSYVGMRSSF